MKVRLSVFRTPLLLLTSLAVGVSGGDGGSDPGAIPYKDVGFAEPLTIEDVQAVLDRQDPDDPGPYWTSVTAVGPTRKFLVFLGDSVPGLGPVGPPENPIEAEYLPLDVGSFGDFLRIRGEDTDRFPGIPSLGTLIPVGTVFEVKASVWHERSIPEGFLAFGVDGLTWSPGR